MEEASHDHQETEPLSEDQQIPPENKNRLPPAKIQYPPGYRFMPTDAELIIEYLQKKINNEPIPIAEINETNLRLVNPKDLTEKYPKLGDHDWYFFTPRDRKYPNGKRPDRGSESGYWKATGADKDVIYDGKIVGFRKALVFYEGKPQKGQKTSWIMHEFRVNGCERKKRTAKDMRLDDWVLCRLYEKSSRLPNCRQNKRANENPSPPLQDAQVSSSDHNEAAAAVANNHESDVDSALKAVNKHEKLAVPENECSYYNYHHPIINTNFGDWSFDDLLIPPYESSSLSMEDPALMMNAHLQSYNNSNYGIVNPVENVNAFGNTYNNAYLNEEAVGFQQANNNAPWRNEAFLSAISCPAINTNKNSNFCDPIYGHIDVEGDKKRLRF